jgi:curved DNA-binding protein
MECTELNSAETEVFDYYEFLQISPAASLEAIHRIYRFWASRYHPDNPKTGNEEMFYRVRAAYDVLSDSERRAQYDAMRIQPAQSSLPLSSVVDFMDEVEGETNRRLALLAILYSQRRTDPRNPEVPLRDLEATLGFPREYLDFTTWYLVQKHYMLQADNSDFTITVAGVDYVEAQRAIMPNLSRLLSSGRLRLAEYPIERRVNTIDRRMGLPDTRAVKVERRSRKRDRRAGDEEFRPDRFGAEKSN